MAEYIERGAVIDRITNLMQLQAQTARAIIEAIHVADVRPVVHGKWVEALHPNVRYYQYKCSICGEFSGHDSEGWIWKPNFCPNCGADMRGDDDGT